MILIRLIISMKEIRLLITKIKKNGFVPETNSIYSELYYEKTSSTDYRMYL